MATKVIRPTTQTFAAEVLGSDVPVLVDFMASWCPPCRVQSPVVERVAEKVGGSARVVVIDVDENPELAQQYGVSSIPSLMVVAGGQVRQRWVGLTPEAKLVDALREAGQKA